MLFCKRSQAIAIRKYKKVTPWPAYAGSEGRQMCGSNIFATSALEGCGFSAPHYGRFTSGKEPVPFVQEAESAWRPVRTTQKIRRHWDSIPKPAIRILSRYWLRHPGRQSENILFDHIFPPPPFLKEIPPKISAILLCTVWRRCSDWNWIYLYKNGGGLF
jgi:hypothetical protein